MYTPRLQFANNNVLRPKRTSPFELKPIQQPANNDRRQSDINSVFQRLVNGKRR